MNITAEVKNDRKRQFQFDAQTGGSVGSLANRVTNKRLTNDNDVAILTSTVQDLKNKLGIKQGSAKRAVSLLEDLPESVLSSVSLYLSKTTRALLAVALTAPSSSWEKCGWKRSPSKASRLVLANPYIGKVDQSYGYYGCCSKRERNSSPRKHDEKWEVLDFMDIEERVRMSLSDADVGALLTCIDAVTHLKLLRLPELVKIYGHGLSPLHGSKVLQFLDVSLSCGSKLPQKPLLSEECVVSLLWSIVNPVNARGNSLKLLHLPNSWKKMLNNEHGRSEFLAPFLKRYGYHSRFSPGELKNGCESCEPRPGRDETENDLDITFDADYSGFKRCPSCQSEYGNCCADYSISTVACSICNKIKCENCSIIYNCDSCARDLCEDCREQVFCGEFCDGFSDMKNCSDCAETEEAGTKRCTRCNEEYCCNCRAMEYSPILQGNVCTECQ